MLSPAGQEDLPAHGGMSPRHEWTCTLHCGRITAKLLRPCTWCPCGSNHTAQGTQDTRQEHLKSMGHMGCQGSTQTACKGTGPKERKDQGRAVEAAADQAPGFRGPMFHFNSTPRAGVFPADPPSSHIRASSSGFLADSVSSPCDGTVSGDSPGGAAQGHPSEEQPAEGVDPQASLLLFGGWEES